MAEEKYTPHIHFMSDIKTAGARLIESASEMSAYRLLDRHALQATALQSIERAIDVAARSLENYKRTRELNVSLTTAEYRGEPAPGYGVHEYTDGAGPIPTGGI